MNGRIAFIQTITSTHPGAGTAIGAIDLPIQREAHTGYPTIQAGGVKGVFRDFARLQVAGSKSITADKADGYVDIVTAFGPPVESAREHAGALVVSDARLLMFPVRSLKGVFALVTCPTVLQRFADDCCLAGMSTPPPTITNAPATDQAFCLDQNKLFFPDGDGHLALLEDVPVKRAGADSLKGLLSGLDTVVGGDTDRVVVVADDVFSYFVRFRTEVVTRNALEHSTKTVKQGALFNEEFLPPKTLLYSVLLMDRPFGAATDAETLATNVDDWLNKRYMQFGGDATTGKGICATQLMAQTPNWEVR